MRFLLVLVCGCYGGRTTTAPEGVKPIAGINTPFDDFNAAKPIKYQDFIWSTNRGSEGKHFDVWEAEVGWDETPHLAGEAKPLRPEVMSPADERGPIVMPNDVWDPTQRPAYQSSYIVIASDREGGKGGLDLYGGALYASALAPLVHFNSPSNDAYLTLPYDRRVLFASDRGGNYDIYEAVLAGTVDGAVTSIARVEALSSDRDDNAPYVDRKIAVFASDRGGNWDLYCANREKGAWGKPKPIAKANTAADEFRPSLFSIGDANFLVFSSNRPGGLGGYDLYATRFDRCR